MRERNWQQYNKQLIQRGSLTFLINPKMFKALSKPPKSKGRGRPIQYSQSVIELLLTVKVHFKLTYRSLQGFAEFFLFKLMPNEKVPNYTLVCKRVIELGKTLPSLARGSSTTVILDASGMKICGEGEWKVKVHGRSSRRKWIKIHLAIDADTQEIVAEITTVSSVGDSKLTGLLLDQIPISPKKVLADGAYDRKQAREAIRERKAEPLIPPPKNARYRNDESERDKAILEILGLGGDKEARTLWGKLTGYSRRTHVETAFSCLKRLFGERLFSKTFERQQVENRVRCLLINKMRAMV